MLRTLAKTNIMAAAQGSGEELMALPDQLRQTHFKFLKEENLDTALQTHVGQVSSVDRRDDAGVAILVGDNGPWQRDVPWRPRLIAAGTAPHRFSRKPKSAYLHFKQNPCCFGSQYGRG